jgi:hypothetical protein
LKGAAVEDHVEPERACRTFLDDLSMMDIGDWINGPVNEVGRRMALLRMIEAAVKERITDVQDALILEMEADAMRLDGYGALRRVPVESSRWREKDSGSRFRNLVAEVVVGKVALDIATGELDPVKRNIARATVKQLYDFIPAFSSVKAAGRSEGIDLDEFRVTETAYKIVLELEDETA